MQITKIVNNNIVISEDKNHKEVVLMGKGLGFQKHKGDEIKLSQIEKTYVMKDHGMTQRFQEMLTDIPIERVKIVIRSFSMRRIHYRRILMIIYMFHLQTTSILRLRELRWEYHSRIHFYGRSRSFIIRNI